MLILDYWYRAGLIAVGALGAYSLGANNIANVMGVFIPVFPFKPLDLYIFHVTGTEQLFILGGIAIGIGVFTYSEKVISTVGKGIMKLRPETALIVVFSSALVLLLFSSETIEHALAYYGLPTIPLVPVSSSQAIVGGIIGIGLAHGGRGINIRMVGRIASGWITTPVLAGTISFVTLFFVQNVFQQKVFDASLYIVDDEVIERAAIEGIIYPEISSLKGIEFNREYVFHEELKRIYPGIPRDHAVKIISLSETSNIKVKAGVITTEIESGWLTPAQASAVALLDKSEFKRTWQFYDALSTSSPEWAKKPSTKLNKIYNRTIDRKRNYLAKIFRKNGNGHR
jgi:PiT family inorganic phosphate transporter